MLSQFIRLQCYGEHSGARRKPHENAYDIVDEAGRVPGSTPHISKPRPPNQLWGMPIRSVRAKVTDFVAIARDRRGARLRRDGTVLYALMASYPLAWRHLQSPEANAEYQRWLHAVVVWLHAQSGDQLQAVVEHVDEGRPHLHAIVFPPLCPRNRIDHRLHPGHAAREAALEDGGDRLAGERAYREGMRLWQDDFHSAVSRYFGHERIGPLRKRFRRDVALIRQSSDRFLERAQSILALLGQRLEAHPMPAGGRATVEIGVIADLMRHARSRLLSGRSNALEVLETALANLVDAETQGGGGGDDPNAPDLPETAYLVGDEDYDTRHQQVADIDPDFDPDLEAPDHDDFEDGWEANDDDAKERETSDCVEGMDRDS